MNYFHQRKAIATYTTRLFTRVFFLHINLLNINYKPGPRIKSKALHFKLPDTSDLGRQSDEEKKCTFS